MTTPFFVQCLLRIPLLQRLLRGHCAVCDVGGEGGNCASCALWASRLAFLSQDIPELLVRRCAVSLDFADDGEEQKSCTEEESESDPVPNPTSEEEEKEQRRNSFIFKFVRFTIDIKFFRWFFKWRIGIELKI